MHLSDVSSHSFQRLKFVAVGFALVMCVFAAHSQTPEIDRGIRVGMRSAGYFEMGKNVDGSVRWGTRAEYNAMWNNAMGGSASRNFVKDAAISGTTVGGLARKGLRGGVYGAAVALVIEGIIDGAGWAIGELQDQVMMPGSGDAPTLGPIAYCIDKSGGDISQRRCSATPGQLAEIVPLQAPPGGCVAPAASVGTVDGVRHMYTCANGYSMIEQDIVMPSEGWPPAWPWAPGMVEPRPITDAELGDKIKENPGLVNTLLQDPRTGRPVVTPEFQQQMDDIKRQLETELDVPHSGDGTVDLDDDTKPDDHVPMEGEWPGFCAWATTVCDFIDWVKTDEPDKTNPDLPTEEADVTESDWTSGLSGGSCPADYSTTVLEGSVDWSWQPLCDIAIKLNPFLVSIAGVVGVCIAAGVRVGKSA